jgi:hypothetical protein
MFFSFPLIGIAAHAAKHTGVIAGLDPRLSGSILVDVVHGVDSSAF